MILKSKLRSKLSWIVLLAVTLVLALVSGLSALILTDRPGSVYVKPLVDPITTLDPRRTRSRTDYMVARTILGQWLRLAVDGELLPDAIESWDSQPDGKLFTLRVRKGVRFHSGRILSVRDLVYAIQYFASQESLTQAFFRDIEGYDEYARGAVPDLAGVTIINDDTVQIRMLRPSFLFLSYLADPKITVLPEKLNGRDAQDFFRAPDGIGPYHLQHLEADGSRLTLVRNKNYFGQPARIERFELQVMNKALALRSFQAGESQDLELFNLSPRELERLGVPTEKYAVSTYSTIALFFNGKKSLFKDLDIRSYIANNIKSIDFSKACGEPLLPATGLIPRGAAGWLDPAVFVDDEKEHRSVQKLNPNFKGQKSYRLLTYGQENKSCIVENLKTSLSKAMQAPVEHLHASQAEAVRIFEKGEYDFLLDHLSQRTFEPFQLTAYIDPASPHNITGFNDEHVHSLVEKVALLAAPSLRAQAYSRLDHYVTLQKFYLLPLVYDVRTLVFQTGVRSHFVPATITLNTAFEEIFFE